jgi:hypothetical protein
MPSDSDTLYVGRHDGNIVGLARCGVRKRVNGEVSGPSLFTHKDHQSG